MHGCQASTPLLETTPRCLVKRRTSGDPNNTNKGDPAPFSPDGSSPNAGSAAQICTELRKQGLHDCGQDASGMCFLP